MKNTIHFLSFLLIGSIAYATTCPNDTEWHAIKARAFQSKLDIVTFKCNNRISGLDEKRKQFERRVIAQNEDFFQNFVKTSNAYYDRAYGIPTDERGRRYRRTAGRNDPNNLRWDEDQVKNLYKLQAQADSALSNASTAQAYCAQADAVVTQLTNASELSQIEEIMTSHAYSNESNHVDCDPNTEIKTTYTASTADTAEVLSVSSRTSDNQNLRRDSSGGIVPAVTVDNSRVDSAGGLTGALTGSRGSRRDSATIVEPTEISDSSGGGGAAAPLDLTAGLFSGTRIHSSVTVPSDQSQCNTVTHRTPSGACCRSPGDTGELLGGPCDDDDN